jgi:hypothetical protein
LKHNRSILKKLLLVKTRLPVLDGGWIGKGSNLGVYRPTKKQNKPAHPVRRVCASYQGQWEIIKIKYWIFKTCNGLTKNNKHRHTTRNIPKPGDVGNLKFSAFTQNYNGLTSWSFEVPASAYCQPLGKIQRNPDN